MTQLVETIHVAPALRAYLLDLADATRRHPSLALGLSPRGLLAWQRATRAHAAAAGRGFATPDDVKELAASVLPHRISIRPELWLTDTSGVSVTDEVLATVTTPPSRG